MRDDDELVDITAVAHQLWLDRGGIGGSPEEDWHAAERIVRKRRAGNSSVSLASNNREHEKNVPAESTGRSENTVADTMTQNQMGTQGQSLADRAKAEGQHLLDRVGNAASEASQRVSNIAGQARGMVQNEPITDPRPEHREGVVARTLEMQTAKLPSDAWLWAAFGSIGLSLAFELSGREKTANFIGHWAPTFLILGLYNKMVKLHGSEGR